ncbi:M1 family metallopeptidase [Nocardia stercoris]|uniref:Aminopeptidase N n=1 Tax=Nocardia stercoris TaxID=2483361 RepID=A0A3M2KVK0_9NOCA|nr:M1 family metallopeptidase [Nocardia stercoris]RMI29652.1 M1 family peptidase [Nocardia stercoris]
MVRTGWGAGCGLLSASVVLVLVSAAPVAAQPSANPLIGAPSAGDPYYPADGNGGYTVGHYRIRIDYDPASRWLAGQARLDATATQPLAGFSLDYSGPDVSAVAVNDLPAGFTRSGDHKLIVTPALPLLPGLPFSIRVDYAGVPGSDPDSGWMFSPSGGAFVAGEPHGAASWYPVNDTPTDKATFDLVASVPPQWEVAGNGIRVSDSTDDARRTVEWVSRHPSASYLNTVAIDRFEFLNQRGDDGTPLESAFAPAAAGRRDLEQRLPEVLDFLESLYGPYPFESGGGIYVDTDLPFSLETQTRPIYAPWADLHTVVHENTHQWWGDWMSLRQWSDVCLNECFASYTADYLWPERKEGEDVDAHYRAAVATHRDDDRFWQIPLQNPGAEREFSSVYYRGPLFLHALRHLLGDDTFFPAMTAFVRSHGDANASMPEFRSYLQTRTTTDLSGFLSAWLDSETRPDDRYLYPGGLGSAA